MSELQDAYDRYWAQREAIKKNDRETLDDRLKPERELLAQAMRNELDNGETVTGIQLKLDNQNRNFFYSVLGDSGYTQYTKSGSKRGRTAVKITEPTPEPSTEVDKEMSPKYDISQLSNFVYSIDIDGVYVGEVTLQDNGHVDKLPTIFEDWTVPQETKEFYKKIIAECREMWVE